ncbi:MAG TPA: response regulator [Verrucomicrobiae bacterium]|nr:response regulator [Verrucomicrobiae bacterium]
MTELGLVKVLLVEDDEDDYIITRDLFSEMPHRSLTLDWVQSFEAGLKEMCRNQHDVCLVDYRLGARNGVDLLRAAIEAGCQAPVILLTGAGEHEIDLEAMRAGAADYLVKTMLQSHSLERSIRYALQRKRAAAMAAFEQARLAAFGAEIGLALTRRDLLPAILERCTRAMMQFLNAGVAQIATLDAKGENFEPLAVSSQLISEAETAPAPSVKLDMAALTEGKPILIKHAASDLRIADQKWIAKHSIAAYAAYPLVLEEKLVGLMSFFTQQPITEQVILEMGSVAHGIALCIEQKRSEQALGVSESKYQTVVESIKEVIFQLDEFGNWTFLNPAWTAITGFEVKPTLGTFFLEYISQEDREHSREIFLKLVEKRMEFCRYETRFLTRNGTIRWIEMYAQRWSKADNGLPAISGTLTDITDRKLAENEIQKLAAFPKVNPNPILEFSKDGEMTYANEAAWQMATSLGKEDLLSILPPEPGKIVRECLASGQTRMREEVKLAGRTITWSFFPVPSNEVAHCYGTDVTDMLSLESQLRHAQKLESVGQLAAGVAHDFNNILTVIQGYADCLLARCNQDKVTSAALKQIGDASKRAAALTRQLLAFSRKQVIQPRVLDLNGVLQNLAHMLQRLLGEDVVLDTAYAQNLGRIEADMGMIEQVVMNLAVNARDAMPRGGKLTVGTSTAEIQQDYVSKHPEARIGHFACLEVRDTGCGMDAATLERIFEPFFTTKEVGKGTGLGLATVYGIVKQHEGWVEVSSAVNQGTTFRVYFPIVAAAEAQNAEGASQPAVVRGGKETILLVEDEPMLRELVREVLSEYDYNVIEASSGAEALRVWDEQKQEIDLLLTDMVMPEGLNGRELADQLKKRKPDLKVIFSSGYSAESLGKDFGQDDTVFLPKPYLPPQLAQVVRNCLDKPARKSELVSA